jgi:hypothetical protein
MPDWLANKVSTAPGLVDDSPEYRKLEQEKQMSNLNQAANAAMKQIQIQTQGEQQKAIDMGTQQIKAMQPVKSPVQDIPVLSPEATQPTHVPTQDEFNITGGAENQPMQPQQQQQPGLTDDSDPAQMVQHIAETLGLNVQQVAALALLGGDIRKVEEQKALMQNLQQPSQPAPMPQNPSPAPPPMPQAPPMPTEMNPASLQTPPPNPQGPPAGPPGAPPVGPPAGMPPGAPGGAPPASPAPMPTPLLPPQ